jgi:hypothetical protein
MQSSPINSTADMFIGLNTLIPGYIFDFCRT